MSFGRKTLRLGNRNWSQAVDQWTNDTAGSRAVCRSLLVDIGRMRTVDENIQPLGTSDSDKQLGSTVTLILRHQEVGELQ